MLNKFILKILLLSGIVLTVVCEAQSFQCYPLNIGDYWEYITDPYTPYSDTISNRITKDTIMTNGKSYAQFEWSNLRYQRYESGKVYFYDTNYNQEYLIFAVEQHCYLQPQSS